MAVNRKRRGMLHGRETEIKIEGINKFRVINGLKPNAVKDRSCLRCSSKFLSESHTNRLCYNCNKIALLRA